MSQAAISFFSIVHRWDLGLFHAIHPDIAPLPACLFLARFMAVGPLVFAIGTVLWLVTRSDRMLRGMGWLAGITAAAALVVNDVIGILWDRPRPFVAGVGHAWITHAATGSFPSDHLTMQWVIAATLLLNRRTRLWGALIAALGLPMAWARIYLGFHYPSDMLGALALGGLTLLGGSWYFRRSR